MEISDLRKGQIDGIGPEISLLEGDWSILFGYISIQIYIHTHTFLVLSGIVW